MNKIFPILIAVLLAFALCSCAAENTTPSHQTQPSQQTQPTQNSPVETTACIHDYKQVNLREPTCTEKGSTTFSCTICGNEYTEDLPLKEHNYSEASRVDATKTETGLVVYRCTVCGDSYDETIPATGSVGIEYSINSDGKTCAVVGLGTCADSIICIPEYYEGYKVTDINTRAFYECTGITEIVIPSTITNIGTRIFYGCSSLHTVYYNSEYSSETNPFLNIDSLQKIVFNGSKIPSFICNGNSNIKEVIIGDNVQCIGEEAFRDCISLTSITIPSNVTTIEYRAFSGCSSLSGVFISNLTAWCNISFGEFGNPLISAHTLYLDNKKVENLVIPDGVSHIGVAFYECTSITSVTIPQSVVSIGDDAFYKCSNLTNVIIPNSVTQIGQAAFLGCESLTSITIPDSVTKVGGSAFAHCTEITTIVLSNNMSCVADDMFRNCDGLISVVIPNGITEIGDGAFYECFNLNNITLPKSITNIGDAAFKGCRLKEILYDGTMKQWDSVSIGASWRSYNITLTICCSDGEIKM